MSEPAAAVEQTLLSARGQECPPPVRGQECPLYSGLSLRGLRELYLRPIQFFTRPNLTAKPALLIAVWLMGIEVVMQRIDLALIAEEYFGVRSGVALGAAHSWPMFWIIAAVLGVLYGWLVWLAGGWWYWIRVALSGADDPEPRLARGVYTYQNLVADLPAIAFAVLYTFLFRNYAAAQDSEALWTLVPALVFLWSCFTSFFGVTAAFPTASKVKAALWFIVAPFLFYTALIVVLIAAAVMNES
jgi:hypothetical protein